VNSLLYPFTLGLLAAVNPCGFPLLPAYLELFVGGSGSPAQRAGRAVSASAWATGGFVALFGTLGVAVQAGWSGLESTSASASRFVMVAVGVGLAGLGLLTVAGRGPKLSLPVLRGREGRTRPVTVGLFGISYGVASIGCALPLFLGGVIAGLGRGGSVHAVAALVAYAIGMGVLLGALALAVALAGPGAGRHLRRAGRLIPAAGGALMITVGSYLTWYWVVDIVSPGRSSWAERLVERVQLDVSTPLGQHAQLIGALLGVALVAALVTGGLAGGRRPQARPGGPSGSAPPAGPASMTLNESMANAPASSRVER
jgi:cytochrome c-type biogenesis protein